MKKEKFHCKLCKGKKKDSHEELYSFSNYGNFTKSILDQNWYCLECFKKMKIKYKMEVINEY
jgi:hypothetical protein